MSWMRDMSSRVDEVEKACGVARVMRSLAGRNIIWMDSRTHPRGRSLWTHDVGDGAGKRHDCFGWVSESACCLLETR